MCIFLTLPTFRKKLEARNDVEKEAKDLTSRAMYPSAQIKMRFAFFSDILRYRRWKILKTSESI